MLFLVSNYTIKYNFGGFRLSSDITRVIAVCVSVIVYFRVMISEHCRIILNFVYL